MRVPDYGGNLGDGFLPAEEILDRGIRLSVGSDSHVRIDPFEELREIETNARRLSGRRNVLVAEGETSPTPYLLRAGWGRDGLEVRRPCRPHRAETSPTLRSRTWKPATYPPRSSSARGAGSSQGRGSRASASPASSPWLLLC